MINSYPLVLFITSLQSSCLSYPESAHKNVEIYPTNNNGYKYFVVRTNAWTDTDHTCYTVYTAGPSGFLAILPVYLVSHEAILYCTIL